MTRFLRKLAIADIFRGKHGVIVDKYSQIE